MIKYILGLAVIGSLIGCDSKERLALQYKVDSLSTQLVASKATENSMNEVGMLIDSIDASRKSLQLRMVEGYNYADYVGRLKDIHVYVKRTEAKLKELEQSKRNTSKATASTIRRFKADLEKRQQEIIELQLQVANLRNENMAQWKKLNQKDSLLSMKDQIIKFNESDIANLARLNVETNEKNQVVVANLYYAQAAALEDAANRTQFAPRKKRETRREALELYRLSLSLGNAEAQKRIDELEKKLS
ncbi:MAG: hypothetical protein SH819_11715 [Cytophagales bacterium]|nr:hypothetical protein [Cytophagales bacterium]